MNLSSLKGFLGPLLAPLLLEAFDQIILPSLTKVTSSISDADLKKFATEVEQAISEYAQAEIKKI